MRPSSPQLPAVALNTNSNVPLRSLSRVHKQCHQLSYSLLSILPPPSPLSTSLPNYSPWMPVIAPTMMATIFTHPSTSPIPTPPLQPPIQIAPSPPPTIPQTFSTLPNQSISTHLMFRVQFLPSSPQNNTPRLNSQLNYPPHTLTLTLTPTSLITPCNWTRLQPPALPISAHRVHTSLWHRRRRRRRHHHHRCHHLNLLLPMIPIRSSPPCPFPPRQALPLRPAHCLTLAPLTHHGRAIV